MNTTIRFFSLALAVNCAVLSHAAPYSFSRVYTGTSVQPGVAINDNGLVALIDGISLITTNGPKSTTIAGPLGPNHLWAPGYPQCLSMNSGGYVAFRGSAGGNMTLLASNGLNTLTIAATTGGFPPSFEIGYTAFSINDSGTVAFDGSVNNAWGLYVGDGTGSAHLVGSAPSQSPAINNADEIAYRNGLTNATEILEGSEILSVGAAAGMFMPDINDSGTVAVISGQHQITIGNGTSSPTFIDGSAYAGLGQGYAYALGDPSLAINNQGVVAFGAYTDTLGGTYGIFVGPNPATDSVIADGALLDGATVESLFFARDGLNNKGQIAFMAAFGNGTQGVYVATPLPEPSTLVLFGIGAVSLLAYAWRRRRPTT